MLAVLNFKNIGCNGWFSKLLFFISPKINRMQIIQDEFISIDTIYFEVMMPANSPRCRTRALKKLKKLMLKEHCEYFLAARGEWIKYLLSEEFKTGEFHNYILKLIPSAVKRLCETAGITPDKVSICLHDTQYEEGSGELIYQLTKLCKNMVYITSDPEIVEEFMQSLYEETGAAVIATADYSKIKDVQIVVSLSQTEKLVKEGAISFGALMFCADKDFIPGLNIPNTIINAFGVNMPQSLLNILPDGMRPWEFVGGLYDISLNKALLSFKIYTFYSFGKNISEKSICEGIMGLDKHRSL